MDGLNVIVDETGKITGYKTNTGGADTVFPFSDTSDATATADQITEGFTAYVNGVKLVGTRPLPVNSLSGSHTKTGQGISTYSINIEFSRAFDTIPKVSATINVTDTSTGYTGSWATVRTSNITRSGFTFTVTRTGNTNPLKFVVTWVATI